MINYGTHVTIKIGRKVVEEYFDITNVDHYDTILGTPFLRKMGIILDFRSPGTIWMGNEVILTGKVFFKSSHLLSQDSTEVNLYGIAARYVVMVVSKNIWESHHDSHTVTLQ